VKIDIYAGDCVESLKKLKDQSVHTCVTSPPYYGLRNYGVEGQLGLEQTPKEFVDNLVTELRTARDLTPMQIKDLQIDLQRCKNSMETYRAMAL